ncbi:hypothetical protein KIL84_021450 [Mauremys mutica]|uniref:Uncharacterized protein n=1 Tax=Mauremys mutica TaxID=74926 RepID=A0A9D4AZW9_9SAUR|nr:hypothetical protein KIL84_021450 [Mauremys mutica]
MQLFLPLQQHFAWIQHLVGILKAFYAHGLSHTTVLYVKTGKDHCTHCGTQQVLTSTQQHYTNGWCRKRRRILRRWNCQGREREFQSWKTVRTPKTRFSAEFRLWMTECP